MVIKALWIISHIFTATLQGKYYLLLDAILQLKTLKFEKVKYITHNYTYNKQKNWALDLNLQMLEPTPSLC